MASGKTQQFFALCALLLLIIACSEGTPSTDSIPESTDVVDEIVVVQTVVQAQDQYQVYVPNVRSSDLSDPPDQTETLAGLDPHLIIETSSSSIKIGEMITVVGRPVQIGKPEYYLVVRDDGVQDAPAMVRATYENVVVLESGSSQILEFVSAQADLYQVTVLLRAKSPGITTITIVAVGEVQASYSQPVMFVAEGSGSVLITVGDG